MKDTPGRFSIDLSMYPLSSGRNEKVADYTQDARRFATWLQQEHPGLKATEVTPTDAKAYRDHLLAIGA